MPIDDNAASREEVLRRIRRAQGVGGLTPPVEDDLVARFRTRAESMQSTCEDVAGWAEVPAAAARYLAANNLEAVGVAWPLLATLDWAAHGIRVEAREA